MLDGFGFNRFGARVPESPIPRSCVPLTHRNSAPGAPGSAPGTDSFLNSEPLDPWTTFKCITIIMAEHPSFTLAALRKYRDQRDKLLNFLTQNQCLLEVPLAFCEPDQRLP